VDSGVEYQGLVLSHLDSLYNYPLVLTRRSEDAEDLLQEVLVRGFQGFASFDRSLSFKGWMFTIIKNAYIDRFRRQRRLRAWTTGTTWRCSKTLRFRRSRC
jgi:RNA polymerase sigma factor (sigma-70 family)